MPVPAGGDTTTYAVDLADVKRHLNITVDTNDDELYGFIGTAQQMIEAKVGPVATVTVTAERHRDVGSTLFLRRPPVLSVTSVTEYAGSTLYSTLTADGYELDSDVGVLRRLSGGSYARFGGTTVLVTYEAGRDPVPDAIVWAIMELVAHLWKSTQAQRGGRGRGTDTPESAAGYGLPNRVVDAIAPFLLPPPVY